MGEDWRERAFGPIHVVAWRRAQPSENRRQKEILGSSEEP